MKFFFKLITSLVVILVIIGVCAGAGIIYINKKYDIDILNNVNQLKKLSKEVKKEEILTNPYSNDDMVSIEEEINKSIENLVSGDLENGFEINFDQAADFNNLSIKLKDRQLAALINNLIEKQNFGEISIGEFTFKFQLEQIDFLNIIDNSVELNVIISINVSDLKEKLSFPFNLIKSYIPNIFYVSSKSKLVHQQEPFSYLNEPLGLSLNLLSIDESKELMKTLDFLFDFGTNEEFNQIINDTFIDLLIGNETKPGFIYSLKEYGVSDYNFIVENNTNYLEIK